MALYRFVYESITKVYTISRNSNSRLLQPLVNNISSERNMRKSYPTIMKVMKLRRKLAGPERLRRRNELIEWNYTSELYAFAKRLHEDISEETLRTVFTHQTYIDDEEQRRKELDVPLHDVKVNLVSNDSLISSGHEIMSTYIKAFIRHCYRLMPEEGVCAVHDFLTSTEILSHVSSNIGTKDLILCPEYPPDDVTFADTLKALIGAIATDRNADDAEQFILDFICPQLIGKDIFDIWDISNPINVLDSILKNHGWSSFEPRLAFESGRNTLESVYLVALYSDKVFLGQGPGETLTVAEEMAAYDALRRLFKVELNNQPLPFGKISKELRINKNSENRPISTWYNEDFEKQTFLANNV